jgi:hypothetical protein
VHFSASTLFAPIFFCGADYLVLFRTKIALSIKILKKYSSATPSSGAIWDQISEQY